MCDHSRMRANPPTSRRMQAIALTMRLFMGWWALVPMLVLVLVLVLPMSSAWAAEGDRNAKTVVNSDRLDHNEKTGTTVFTGRVTLTKGTLILTGDRLELQQQPDGSVVAVMGGAPARFQQARATPGEFIRGHSRQVRYDSKADVTVLIGEALMRRENSGRLIDELVGDQLRYDNTTEQYRAVAGADSGRTQMTIMPRGAAPTR